MRRAGPASASAFLPSRARAATASPSSRPEQVPIRDNKRITCWLYTIGVDAGKATIMANLKVQEPGPKYCHFNRHPDAGYDLNFFNGLLSEVGAHAHAPRRPLGVEKLPGHNRNEALDCRDYANAGLKIINPDMDAIERRLQGLEENRRPRSSDGSGNGTTGPTPSTTGKEDRPQ